MVETLSVHLHDHARRVAFLGGMMGDDHVDFDAFDLDRPADVHAFGGDAFGLGIDGDLVDRNQDRSGFFGQGEGVTQVVTVVVGDDHDIGLLDVLGGGRTAGIAGEKGVDEERSRTLDFDGRMAKPSDFHVALLCRGTRLIFLISRSGRRGV
jgi:hypothetical protein